LILVDRSVWIDFFSCAPGAAGRELRRLIAEAEPVALTGVVVTEVLQGLTRDIEQVEPYLGMWTMLEPRGFSTYRSAAAIFRLGRSHGIALTTIDTLIAAIAIEHGAILFTLDRDFARVAQITSLLVHELA
jgi:predicted nucleic acid-binding protein